MWFYKNKDKITLTSEFITRIQKSWNWGSKKNRAESNTNKHPKSRRQTVDIRYTLTSLAPGAWFPIILQVKASLTFASVAAGCVHADLRAHRLVIVGTFINVWQRAESEKVWETESWQRAWTQYSLLGRYGALLWDQPEKHNLTPVTSTFNTSAVWHLGGQNL